MSFTGEEDFCLAAHVTKISGEDADVYVYEKLTYLPATTIYYEDDFVADENYHDGVENTVTGHDFGKWSKVTSGDPQTAVVGLPASSVKESRDRVAAALSRRGIDLGEVYTVGYAVEKLSELL